MLNVVVVACWLPHNIDEKMSTLCVPRLCSIPNYHLIIFFNLTLISKRTSPPTRRSAKMWVGLAF